MIIRMGYGYWMACRVQVSTPPTGGPNGRPSAADRASCKAVDLPHRVVTPDHDKGILRQRPPRDLVRRRPAQGPSPDSRTHAEGSTTESWGA